jgi:hypothetical protein
MQLFVRIPSSSLPKRRRTGGPNARNILHLVSLLNNGKPESRRRLRRSRLVVVPKTRTKKRMTMSNWYSALYFEYIICHARLWRFYVHACLPTQCPRHKSYITLRRCITRGRSLSTHERQSYHPPYPREQCSRPGDICSRDRFLLP